MEAQSNSSAFEIHPHLPIEQGEPFADLSPPKVIQSFVLGDDLVTLTESFFTNNQLEVYNVETKVTSYELVMVTHPINRKKWRLAYITRNSRENVLISGIYSENDRRDLQIYILRKLKKDPASVNTKYGFHFSMIKTHQSYQNMSETFAENCVIQQTQNGEVYFLGPDYITRSSCFKQKMEDLPTTSNPNAGGGGGLFGGAGGGLFGGAGGGGGGQGGGLFGGTRIKGLPISEKQLTKYAQFPRFPGDAFLGYCSFMTGEGKLYVFGGENQEKQVLNELWQFDTKTEEWTDLGPNNGEMLGRTGAVMHSNGEQLFICGGLDSNKALCNSVIVYNIDTDTWKIFKVDPSCEPIHTCCLYLSQLLIIRGRMIEVGWNREWKPYFEISGGHKIETQDNTVQDYRKLFADMPYHDVTFKVEDQEIPAHRALLSIRCPHFLQVFPAGLKDPSNKVIEVPDLKANVFKGLLKYLYCGDIPQDENVVIELLKASETYQIEELREKCQDYLAFNLRIDNVANLATLARNYKADQLKTAILKFIKANESKLDVGDLNQFDKDFLIEILMYKPKNI